MQHENDQNRLEDLFSKWLSGEALSNSDLMLLRNDPEWADRMAVTAKLKAENEQFEADIDVPDWNIEHTFTRQQTRHNARHQAPSNWWSQNGFSALAMTFSIFACSVLAFDLKVFWGDEGLTVMTGQQQKLAWQQEQQEMFNTQLESWVMQSREHIDETFASLEQRQAENTTRLANYLLENSRVERQEDLQRLAKAIQTQQQEDLNYIESEINRLQYQFSVASRRYPSQLGGQPELGMSEEE